MEARTKYRYKTRPYRHQVAAIKKLLDTGWGGALLMAPRTGKTKTFIDYASALHAAGKVNRVLIVCPLGVIGVWEQEIKAHCPERHRVTIWDRDGRRDQPLPAWGRDILDFVIINYDAFSSPGQRKRGGGRARRGGRFEVRDKLRLWKPQLMGLDESHRIKTPSARKTAMIVSVAWQQKRPRGKPAYKVCLVPYRVIMTGTPLTKKKRVFDIYSQWQFLNPESKLVKGHTLDSFKRTYALFTNRNGYPQWLRNRNEGKLRRLMHEDSFAITRDECFDLPARMPDQIIPVKLTGHTAEVYDEMAEEMVAKLKSGEITQASIRLVQSMRLAQITSGLAKTDPTPGRPDGRLVRIGRDKLDVLESILSDLFEADEKVVIGARWKGDMASIEALCDRLKVKHWSIKGGQSRSERDAGIAEFRRHDEAGAIIMQPGAGAEGIDLSTASIFIWYSMTNSWVQTTQAEDRVALSNRSTIFMYLLAEGTVDELLYDTLKEDGDLAQRITASPDKLLRNFKR